MRLEESTVQEHTCSLGGTGCGYSKAQSTTAMTAAAEDTPVSCKWKLRPVAFTNSA